MPAVVDMSLLYVYFLLCVIQVQVSVPPPYSAQPLVISLEEETLLPPGVAPEVCNKNNNTDHATHSRLS